MAAKFGGQNIADSEQLVDEHSQQSDPDCDNSDSDDPQAYVPALSFFVGQGPHGRQYAFRSNQSTAPQAVHRAAAMMCSAKEHSAEHLGLNTELDARDWPQSVMAEPSWLAAAAGLNPRRVSWLHQ